MLLFFALKTHTDISFKRGNIQLAPGQDKGAHSDQRSSYIYLQESLAPQIRKI